MQNEAAPSNSSSEQGSGIDAVFSLIYEELLQIARRARGADSQITAGTAAIVNEAWMRLRGSPQLAGLPMSHFKAIAVKAMRQILVDAARRRNAQKRGAGKPKQDLDAMLSQPGSLPPDVELLALNRALDELERVDPPKAQILDCHYFGGMTVAEVAAVCEVSTTSVERQLRAAKAWLLTQLAPGNELASE